MNTCTYKICAFVNHFVCVGYQVILCYAKNKLIYKYIYILCVLLRFGFIQIMDFVHGMYDFHMYNTWTCLITFSKIYMYVCMLTVI